MILSQKMEAGTVSIIITTDENLIGINRQFLEHDYFTDVITFNYNEADVINGEIYISADTVKDNAGLYRVRINDEMSRVILHGVLHLAGYDDKTEPQKEIMRKMEDLWLGKLEGENGF